MSRPYLLALTLLLAVPASARTRNPADLPLGSLKLPPGFHIALYATGLRDARSLALGPDGVVFVGTREAGNVYALVPNAARTASARTITLAHGLQNPNGVAVKDGALYVAERSRILRYDDIAKHLDAPPKPVVVRDDFPGKAHHGWKFIAFGPDGQLYVPVGAPCNVCKEKDPIYASITRLSPDGKTREVYAGGIRNTVGFDWHPTTKQLWFTDNGRDEMGDDVPDDELDVAPKAGLDFGFPYCHAGDVPDPKFGKEKPCSQLAPTAAKMGPHVAAVGMRFYTGAMFPAEYKNDIIIAEHGSWNRSVPLGYRLARVKVEGDKVVKNEIFVSGWLPESPTTEDPKQPVKLRADETADVVDKVRGVKKPQAWGRPVDVLVMPDGALLVSDDEADVVYRITYSPNR
jgi:glucose/arabinose dehydrogenase